MTTTGELADKQHILIKQLDRKFDITEENKNLILSSVNPDELDIALDEIITAETLNQVLEKLK